MLGTGKLSIWIITGVFAVTTVFFNLYIFLTSSFKYKQWKQWSSSETIITALSAANVVHQLICYFWMTMDEVDSKCYISQTPYSILLVLIFSLKFTIVWDTSFLTFYYSIKLVNTTNRCFMQIQALIIKHVPLVVFLIPLCGLGTCMPILVVFQHDNNTNANQDCGIMIPETYSGVIYEALYLFVSDVFPGIFMVKCCISISVHLAVHLGHMKASTNGAHRPKTGSQLRVIQMALSLAAVFLCFLAVDLYVNYQIAVNHENAISLAFLFISIFTTATPTVLIYGKKSLWKALIHDFNIFLAVYPCLSCLKVSEEKDNRGTAAKDKN